MLINKIINTESMLDFHGILCKRGHGLNNEKGQAES